MRAAAATLCASPLTNTTTTIRSSSAMFASTSSPSAPTTSAPRSISARSICSSRSSLRTRRAFSSSVTCGAEGENKPARRSTVLGDIVETTGDALPEPESDDFFQGDKWEWLGSAAAVAVPALVLAAIAVGAFAAKTYDSGADSVLLPASAEDRPAVVVPVEEFESKVREMQR